MPGDLPDLVIFDLDGTLVDTAPDLTAALNHALIALGRAPVDAMTVRHLVGHGARALLERGLTLSGGGEAEVVRGLPLFLDYYRAHLADASRPFDGIEVALDALVAAGVTLAICTNKPAAMAAALVDALGWHGRFAAILGGDSVADRKPAAGHVVATAAGAGIDLRNSVFVGDSAVDVAAARAAGVPIVIVSFGFAAEDAAELGADAVIDHFDALLATLKQLR